MSKDGRARNFRFLVYPESVNPDYERRIEELQIPILMSPLHKPDDDSEESYKEHWHVIMLYKGQKSNDDVIDMIVYIFGSGACIPKKDKAFQVSSIDGAVRYFTHVDYPNKPQYNPNDIRCYCGAEWEPYYLRSSDEMQMLKEITEFIDEFNITKFNTIIRYSRDYRPEWFRVLTKKATIFLVAYVKSVEYERKAGTGSEYRNLLAIIDHMSLTEDQDEVIVDSETEEN